MVRKLSFDSDDTKDKLNKKKHGISFAEAQYAFSDSNRVILEDLSHSDKEKRYYCIRKVGAGIITVRFTFRNKIIRIFGVGYWRKGKKIYEEQNKIY
jgi:uncharacterized DUF497 family protein